MNHLYVKQFLVVAWEFYMSKWGCYLVLSIKVMRKVSQRGTTLWVLSISWRMLYLELISLSCVGAYIESWVKLLGPPFTIPKTLREL
jgi:hypothetical protein